MIRRTRTPGEAESALRLSHGNDRRGPGWLQASGNEAPTSFATETVLVAMIGHTAAATLTIVPDSPDGPAEWTRFPEAVAALRGELRRWGMAGRFGLMPGIRPDLRDDLTADLIRWTGFLAIHRYRFETVLFVVTRILAGFLEERLGARPMVTTPSAGPAPARRQAVLMRADAERLPPSVRLDIDALAARFPRRP